jgi:nicotinamidase-related amidase
VEKYLLITNPAVVLVDVQNEFFVGKMKLKSVNRIIEPLQRLLVAARKNSVPVIYAVDAHYPQDVEVVRNWGTHAIKGTWEAEVIPELAAEKAVDHIVEKRTYSGFFETGLDSLLRGLYNGDSAKTVILGGLHTNLCVRHTAADAFFRGYHIVVAEDGVEAFNDRDQRESLKYLEYVYDAKIMAVNSIIQEIVK